MHHETTLLAPVAVGPALAFPSGAAAPRLHLARLVGPFTLRVDADGGRTTAAPIQLA